jgi:Squalene-hopene cyclase C-terminal domain/Prenyltransferase and squalene oxidase repeat
MSWQLASAAVLALVLAAGLGWFERTRPSAKVVSLVATMAALAVVGRIAFAPFPNVKPTTDIVLLAGFAIGAAPGFAVGAITALASNLFFGQGPWTPWQMVAWGLVGVAGGVLGRLTRGREPRRLPLALVCAAAGFGYGGLLDLYQWTLSATHNVASYVAVSGTSFPYNLAHAVGNFVFALAIGPAFVRALRRYRRRFEVRWEQPVAAAALAAALLVAATSAPAADAATSTPQRKAVVYIERAQNTDGGFGGARAQSSSPLYTGWVGLGLAAAGKNPRDVRNGKATPISYTRGHMPAAGDIGELERTMLLLRAAGVSTRSFAKRDLVAELLALRMPDGSYGGLVDHTAFAILALRASGISTRALRPSALWLERQQNDDGGFGFGPKGGSSDADDTGSAIQALVAAGRRRKSAVRAAVGYLRDAQHADGGFGQMKQDASNAQSSAWAVQGLVAAGRNPASLRRGGHTPISYIVSLQQANGEVRYSRTSAQTPVWVTGEALTALSRKAFPVQAPRRRAVVVARHEAHRSSATPIAHAAAKPPTSHGQTLVPARPRAAAASRAHARPEAATTSAARKPQLPSTAHDDHHGNGALGTALGAFGAAAILAGVYLTRRRLRGRSNPI